MQFRDLGLSYEEAAHGVQSAIKYEMEHDAHKATRPHIETFKHLRTGLDCRASDAAGLAQLLIDKGVFTQDEYIESMRIAMNEELVRYTEHIRKVFNLPANFDFR